MWLLGLRLMLRSGKEAWIRLAFIAVAMALSVSLLLSIISTYRAFSAANNRPNWANPQSTADERAPLLWVYSTDTYKNKNIKRVDVAILQPDAPVISGITHMPKPGEYYTSPALNKLLETAPENELGDRFPGQAIGTIGKEALAGPNELVAIVGRSPDDLARSPQSFPVNSLSAAPEPSNQSSFFNFLFVIGGLGILFPMIVFIATASKISAARREERYAAIRLAGATPRQIKILVSTDALLGATIGTLLGIAGYLIAHAIITKAIIDYLPWHPSDITPTTIGYMIVMGAVPVIAVGTSLLSLRRVQITPLGVSRKATPAPPRAWRVLPFVVGVITFVVAALTDRGSIMGLGFGLSMIGLLVGGPWLTFVVTKLVAARAKGAATLLATRRLADNPRAAFRAVSGLVLAVFIGTVFSSIAPTLLAEQRTSEAQALENVLTAAFYVPEIDPAAGKPIGLPVEQSQALLKKLRDTGAAVFPIYAVPSSPQANSAEAARKYGQQGIDYDTTEGFISCSDLQQLSVLGTCVPGLQTTSIFTSPLILDHETSRIVRPDAANTDSAGMASLPLQAVMVRSDNPALIEKIRTILATHAIPTEIPQTFGEVKRFEQSIVSGMQRAVYIVIVVTLGIAGCSLAVAVGSSLIERKRPFALLRLSGVPVTVLNKVVLLESAIPLIVAALISAIAGYGVAFAIVKTVAPAGSVLESPAVGYYVTLVGCLLGSLLVTALTLPMLEQLTKPDNARFE